MCGIFVSISRAKPIQPSKRTEEFLRRRGPDQYQLIHRDVKVTSSDRSEDVSKVHLTFASSVLALRGVSPVVQPLQDEETGCIFLWNGEAWSIDGNTLSNENDTRFIFQSLLSIVESHPSDLKAICALLDSIHGPYAFVFYHAPLQTLLFGRDCIGRRSLLVQRGDDGVEICSISADPGEGFEESSSSSINALPLTKVSQAETEDHGFDLVEICTREPFTIRNRTVSAPEPESMQRTTEDFHKILSSAVKVRSSNILDPRSLSTQPIEKSSIVAVLFSGGVDCTLLARLLHDSLPQSQPIDLLNVAFENPRLVKHRAKDTTLSFNSIYEECPDRMTGRASHHELESVCPGRKWRFIAIDVPFVEVEEHRAEIISLLRPSNTEMDLSIGMALFFASRGRGTTEIDGVVTPYTTPARILFSGLGADELFGGYQRHTLALQRKGPEGLLAELDLDVQRIGQRNLGRDDRIISHWGKEVRFPFLDENVISWTMDQPWWIKHGAIEEQGSGEQGKKIVRALASELGMVSAAQLSKRAIQFGARTAKMSTGGSKGTDKLDA